MRQPWVCVFNVFRFDKLFISLRSLKGFIYSEIRYEIIKSIFY
jgi:hypothetical protein